MSNGEPPGGSVQIQITAPQRFTPFRQFLCSAYGLLLFLPTIIVAIVAVSLMQLGVLTLVLPFIVLLIATFFLPFGFGNAYVARLAESLKPTNTEAMLVQMAFVPRLHYGFLGVMEDADDIGWLSCSDQGLRFHGDSVKLSIPLRQVRAVRRRAGGFRGLFLYWRTAVTVEGLEEFTELWFAERSSLVLPTSWKINKRLYESVASKIPRSDGKKTSLT